MDDGFLQGACEAPVAFSLALRVALAAFEQAIKADESIPDDAVRYWAYVDDITLAILPVHAAAVLQHLRAALLAHGLELRADKCTAYSPQPEDAAALASRIEAFARYTPEGLSILGTASNGDYKVIAVAGATSCAPAEERLAAARTLATRIRDLCTADIEGRRLAPAWKLVSIVLNNALSFDCSVIPPGALAPHALQLDELVESLLPLFLGGVIPGAATLARLRLPRSFGGCDLPSAQQRSQTGFLAQFLAIAPHIRRHTPQGPCPLTALGLTGAAVGAQAGLRECGLRLDAHGLPSPPNAAPLDPVQLGVAALRHRQRHWKNPLAAAVQDSPLLAHVKGRLNHLGGDENALWLTANAGPETAPLDDIEWLLNMRVRLDLPVLAQGLCQHRRMTVDGRPGKLCLAPLDTYGHHAVACMIGGNRTTVHDVGCHLLHSACCCSGLRAQREVVTPILATPSLTEPRIDVDAWGHPGLPHLRLDFTVTDPAASRHAASSLQPAGAADHAERDKATKYGNLVGGAGVTGVALELSGRHGPNLDALLRRLAGYRRAITCAAGRDDGRPLHNWRLAISIALARFTASAIISATEVSPLGLTAARRSFLPGPPSRHSCHLLPAPQQPAEAGLGASA